MRHTCPFCQCGDPEAVKALVPPEPPVGTWVKDRHGGTSYHQTPGGWGQPGIMPFGKWESMWLARGPLVECGPWGAPLEPASDIGDPCPKHRAVGVNAECPDCDQPAEEAKP